MDLHKYELNRPIVEIILGAIVLLAIGQGYIMYSMSNRAQAFTPAVPGTFVNQQSPNAGDIEDITPTPSTVLVPMAGEVARIEPSAVIVTGIGGTGTERRIEVNGKTAITLRGDMKDQSTIDKEISAFREQSRVLENDVKANEHALSRLIAPSPFVQTRVSLQDIRVGDYVGAFIDSEVAISVEILRDR
jgi:hypothetical protein